jgi:hypothetical protein
MYTRDLDSLLLNAEYTTVVVRLILWSLAFRCLCLVSRECREIRADLFGRGANIDPIVRLVERANEIAAELSR